MVRCRGRAGRKVRAGTACLRTVRSTGSGGAKAGSGEGQSAADGEESRRSLEKRDEGREQHPRPTSVSAGTGGNAAAMSLSQPVRPSVSSDLMDCAVLALLVQS